LRLLLEEDAAAAAAAIQHIRSMIIIDINLLLHDKADYGWVATSVAAVSFFMKDQQRFRSDP
jgi:hypothetical protein